MLDVDGHARVLAMNQILFAICEGARHGTG